MVKIASSKSEYVTWKLKGIGSAFTPIGSGTTTTLTADGTGGYTTTVTPIIDPTSYSSSTTHTYSVGTHSPRYLISPYFDHIHIDEDYKVGDIVRLHSKDEISKIDPTFYLYNDMISYIDRDLEITTAKEHFDGGQKFVIFKCPFGIQPKGCGYMWPMKLIKERIGISSSPARVIDSKREANKVIRRRKLYNRSKLNW